MVSNLTGRWVGTSWKETFLDVQPPAKNLYPADLGWGSGAISVSPEGDVPRLRAMRRQGRSAQSASPIMPMRLGLGAVELYSDTIGLAPAKRAFVCDAVDRYVKQEFLRHACIDRDLEFGSIGMLVADRAFDLGRRDAVQDRRTLEDALPVFPPAFVLGRTGHRVIAP